MKNLQEYNKSALQNDSFSERFLKIKAVFFEHNNRKFAKEIGVDERGLSSICNGKREPGKKICEKVLSACPEISRQWLLYGEGEMLNTERTKSEAKAKEERSNSVNNVTQINHLGNNNSTIGGGQTDEFREIIRSKDETIQKMGETIAVLTAEIEQLRNYVSQTSSKYINVMERMMYTTNETATIVKQCSAKIGFTFSKEIEDEAPM